MEKEKKREKKNNDRRCHEWWHTYHLMKSGTLKPSKHCFSWGYLVAEQSLTRHQNSPWSPFFVTCLLTGTETRKPKVGESYAHLFTRKKTQGLVLQTLSWSCMTWIVAITIRLREPTSFGDNQRKKNRLLLICSWT